MHDFVHGEDGSAHNGPMFHTAGRLLREATKVELAGLGHDRLFLRGDLPSGLPHLESLESEGS